MVIEFLFTAPLKLSRGLGMNVGTRWDDKTSRAVALVDELLVDIAVKIQLSPTLHEKACDHYGAINDHLDREGSPLKARVQCFYPQGSMSIGATIRSRDEEDLFDIDLVAEIEHQNETPGDLLDLLFEAINGKPGSAYYGKVRRQTRCVTIDYADMHLDITPMVRMQSWPNRGGYIAHAHEDDLPSQHQWVAANPWGFADWFKSQTPKDGWFRELMLRKSLAVEARILVEKAAAAPVPDHEHVFAKPMAVVALQLTKRWARLNHERRGAKGRCIPSVALSRSFAENAGQTDSLVDELIHQADAFRALLTAATAKGEVVDLRNPRLYEDRLTDRWPGNVSTQWQFAEDLKGFIGQLQAAKQTSNVAELQDILIGLFGERTTKMVVEEFYKRAGEDVAGGRSRVVSGSGAALAGLSQPSQAGTRPSPGHRFYGDN